MEESTLERKVLYVLEKLRDKFEMVKLGGFPEHLPSRFGPRHDAVIPEARWRKWEQELDIDYSDIKLILQIIEGEGLLNEFKFMPDYV